MPIITIQFIKDVVANDEQKQELLVKMTDTFISVVGEVARPFVYCIIQETPQMEWSHRRQGDARPRLPDRPGVHGPARQVERDHGRVRRAIGQAAHEAAGGDPEKDHLAEKMWAGAKE